MNTPTAATPSPQTRDALRATLQSTVENLELERQRAAAKALQNSVIGGVCVVVVCLFVLQIFGGFFAPFVLFGGVIALIGVIGGTRGSAAKDYRAGFKLLILPTLMRAFGECEYSPHGFISESDFRACQLFRAPEIYSGEDLVEIKIGATAMRVSQIHAEYETRDKDNNRERHTIFRGLFVIADFNKNFQGMTLLYPDTAEKMLGRFGQTLQSLTGKIAGGGRELVKLEDPEFEKEFVVYSHDQVEARYLLSTALMRRLLELRRRAGTSFYASFLAGKIYLAIPSFVDYFEPPSLSTPLTLESLQPCIDQMQFIFGLVNDLDLNTRIWSKAAMPNAMQNATAPNATSPTSKDAFWIDTPPTI